MPKTLPPLDEMAAAFWKVMQRNPAQGERIIDEADPDMDDSVESALVAQDTLRFVEAAVVVIRQAEESSRFSINKEYPKRMLGAVRKWEAYLALARKGAFAAAVSASPTAHASSTLPASQALHASPTEDESLMAPSASAAPSTSVSSSLLPAADIHPLERRSDRSSLVPDTIRQLSEMGVSLHLECRACINYISIAW